MTEITERSVAPRYRCLNARVLRYASRTQVVEWEIARNGLAIAKTTDQIASRFPEFEPVLTEIEPFKIPSWLVVHREVHTSSRIRTVFDLIADQLSG